MGRLQVRAVPEPHSADPDVLRRQRDVYRRNETPVRGADGSVRPVAIRPAGPEVAGRHLDEISRRWGDAGVARTVKGLGITRGWDYADVAVRHASTPVQRHPAAQAVAANIGGAEPAQEAPVFSAAAPLRRSQPSGGVPAQVRSRLPAAADRGLDRVRIHDDTAAHEATRALGARAVTTGRSIYMGAGEYEPSTPAGQRLLAHEIAHAIQQDGAAERPVEQMKVSAPGSAPEVEADRFADAVGAGAVDAPLPIRGSAPEMALMRTITFTRANDVVVDNDPGIVETGTGAFDIGRGNPTAPHFSWTTDFTIHGDAGDPFADFQVGPLQVLRSWWFNVWWGSGANRTHRTGTVATPIRDALTGNTWYADALASANFGADGDVRSTSLTDSPGIRVPLANPNAGRVSTRGWFNYGVTFISYMSAQNTAASTFQHLAHCYWNMSLNGSFDTTQPAGSQVTLTSGVANHGSVRSGVSAADPPILGGDVPNDVATVTDT